MSITSSARSKRSKRFGQVLVPSLCPPLLRKPASTLSIPGSMKTPSIANREQISSGCNEEAAEALVGINTDYPSVKPIHLPKINPEQSTVSPRYTWPIWGPEHFNNVFLKSLHDMGKKSIRPLINVHSNVRTAIDEYQKIMRIESFLITNCAENWEYPEI
uniref:Uncharacterized protein n=1 Tax=Glossina austeni TaxID=7395 RepID=A0A1A9UW72_GLOAU